MFYLFCKHLIPTNENVNNDLLVKIQEGTQLLTTASTFFFYRIKSHIKSEGPCLKNHRALVCPTMAFLNCVYLLIGVIDKKSPISLRQALTETS